MGLSDKPTDGRYAYTLQSRVDDLATLLARLGVTGPVTLAVHDWGGMIGFGWALSHLPQVQRLVILNTAAFPLPAAKRMPWQLSLGRDSRIGGWLIRAFNLFARGAAWLGTERRLPARAPRLHRALLPAGATRSPRCASCRTFPARGDPAWPLVAEAGPAPARIRRSPVFIGWGLRDFVFDRHCLDMFPLRLPQAEVHAFEDAGHYVLEDKHEVWCRRSADSSSDTLWSDVSRCTPTAAESRASARSSRA
jgi:haloalkane dehalogenase